MENSNFRIPVIIFSIYLVTSIVPIIQVYFGYIIGGIVSILARVTSIDSTIISILLTLIVSIHFLIKYYKADKYKSQILNASLASIFISSLMMFTFEEFLINTEIYKYQFVIGAILIGICLSSVEYVRQKH